MKDDSYLENSISIQTLNLSKRVQNRLATERIHTVAELSKCSIHDIEGIPAFGRKAIRELIDALGERDIILSDRGARSVNRRIPLGDAIRGDPIRDEPQRWVFSIAVRDYNDRIAPDVIFFSGTDETRRILFAIADASPKPKPPRIMTRRC